MPAMFALGDKVIGNPQVATFAAFGSFAMLLLVDFGGPMAERIQAQAALAVTGGVFVCLATLASQTAWLAAVAMAVVGFSVIFAGVVSSVLAGATTALLRPAVSGNSHAGVRQLLGGGDPGQISRQRRIAPFLPHAVAQHVYHERTVGLCVR